MSQTPTPEQINQWLENLKSVHPDVRQTALQNIASIFVNTQNQDTLIKLATQITGLFSDDSWRACKGALQAIPPSFATIQDESTLLKVTTQISDKLFDHRESVSYAALPAIARSLCNIENNKVKKSMHNIINQKIAQLDPKQSAEFAIAVRCFANSSNTTRQMLYALNNDMFVVQKSYLQNDITEKTLVVVGEEISCFNEKEFGLFNKKIKYLVEKKPVMVKDNAGNITASIEWETRPLVGEKNMQHFVGYHGGYSKFLQQAELMNPALTGKIMPGYKPT